MELSGVLFLLFLSAIVGLLAWRKGRNPWAWFGLTVLISIIPFGFVAMLVCVLTFPFVCSRCKENRASNPKSGIPCHSCGFSLQAKSKPVVAVSASPEINHSNGVGVKDFSLSARDKEVVTVAANMLKLQLIMCSSINLEDDFIRGYLLGFFDASLQVSGVVVRDEDHFATLLSVGHWNIIGGAFQNSILFTIETLSRSDVALVEEGRQLGGGEYVSFMAVSTNRPMGLASYCHGLKE